MSYEVIARINTSTPSGRKIVRELENKKAVTMEYPLPEGISGQETSNVDEVFDKSIKILSDHYGVDCRKIWESIE